MHWLAGLLELSAKWLVGNKKKSGFIVHIISGIVWSIVAYQHPEVAGGLMIIVLPSIVINIRNYVKWRHEDKEKSNH
jgi:uncharacterized membrane protein YeaQ/YmgE (transglycosylase-associated protein family)